jgi:hypothetical protein
MPCASTAGWQTESDARGLIGPDGVLSMPVGFNTFEIFLTNKEKNNEEEYDNQNGAQ